MGEPVRIRSYVQGRWEEGEGEGARLLNPATEEVLATASTRGVDLGAALHHARAVGGKNLRQLGFAERARVLKGLAALIREHRDELLEIAMRNGGNTKGDAKFDVDGASGSLRFYSRLGCSLGGRGQVAAGERVALQRSPA